MGGRCVFEGGVLGRGVCGGLVAWLDDCYTHGKGGLFLLVLARAR